jgi:3'-5' exonuclease
MLHHLNLRNILFLDIETVPQYGKYHEMPEHFVDLWEKKCSTFKRDTEDPPELVYKRAGIYAEFGKIICISCGFFGNGNTFRIKSFYGHDEAILLKEFSSMLEKSFSTPDKLLCAHNGKEFDFPYICRRLLVNLLPLPPILQIAGKKPWEIGHIDTMELWKFGDFKSFTSLNLLAAIFGIPTPKDDIDGSMVGDVYWQSGDLERIVTYCQKDVLTVAQILRKFRGEKLIEEYNVEYAEPLNAEI